METFLIRALQLILSLSILVLLHEFGHFFFARLFKVRVDKFYMFFNPYFSILRAKKLNGKWSVKFFAKNVPSNDRPKKDAFGKDILDEKGKPVMELIPLSEMAENDWRKYPETTEWGIGWLPLGGFCKIAGMIDESMDKTQLNLPPQDWEYRAKPVWQRMPIIVGGVLVNFVLAMVIYAAVLFTWGKEYLPFENATYGLQYSETMIESGFQQGDLILSVDGRKVEQRADAIEDLLIEGKKNVVVLRNGVETDLIMPDDFVKNILASEEKDLISVRFPFVIQEAVAGNPAASAGLTSGDSIVAVAGEELSIFQDIALSLYEHKGKTIQIAFYRNGMKDSTMVAVSEEGKIGVAVKPFVAFFETKKIEYGFIESIPAGINLGVETLVSYIKQFKLVFTKEGSKQIGGFGSIGSMFPQTWDWQVFWSMTALLSVILAFMNFLPIPALDGGHVLFLVYEMITGRKPSEKFLEYAQTAGMLLLFALLIFANGNDIFKAFFKN